MPIGYFNVFSITKTLSMNEQKKGQNYRDETYRKSYIIHTGECLSNFLAS